MSNFLLERIERMAQVQLEALCALAREVTGKDMAIGCFEGGDVIGATSLSPNIKFVARAPLKRLDPDVSIWPCELALDSETRPVLTGADWNALVARVEKLENT